MSNDESSNGEKLRPNVQDIEYNSKHSENNSTTLISTEKIQSSTVESSKTSGTLSSSRDEPAAGAVAAANFDAETKRSASKEQDFHLIKWIEFNCEYVPILLQNVNGPCPLLAIFNLLLLKKKIVLGEKSETITTQRVLSLLAEHILEIDTSKLTNEERANFEHNVQDSLSVLDKLQTGLDVNLKFDGVDQFEYTRECIIFDLFHIPLYHGWIIDPQDIEMRRIISENESSYNQLVEKMIRQRHSENEELCRESLLIEQFLDENRSQLTHYGILQLNQTMRENQLAVFFRNNHFSTIWKNQDQLLVLVSDQGFADHPSIVFETLTDVDNDTQFTDGYGRIWRKPEPVNASNDRELALSIQKEEELRYQQALQQQEQQQRPLDPNNAQSQSRKNKNRNRKQADSEEKSSCSLA